MTTWRLPQPYEELDHTADAGVCVRAESREGCLARLILGFAQMLAGGGEVASAHTSDLAVPAAEDDPVILAVDVMRAVASAFFDGHRIPCAVEVIAVDATGARLRIAYGDYDEDRHADGLDIKAVTWHAARFEPTADGWLGQVVFDI